MTWIWELIEQSELEKVELHDVEHWIKQFGHRSGALRVNQKSQELIHRLETTRGFFFISQNHLDIRGRI